MKLSEHFDLSEFCESDTANKYGINNFPDTIPALNISLLVHNILEPARVALGEPIKVTSGFRCVELNHKVGGVKNSQHIVGQAADLQCKNMKKLFDILSKMDVDQLLYERSKTAQWIHVSYNSEGNRHYINNNYRV